MLFPVTCQGPLLNSTRPPFSEFPEMVPLWALAIQMSRGASSHEVDGGGDSRSRWLIVMLTSGVRGPPSSAFELPMTDGPEFTSEVQRIGPENRTAKPSSVVFPHSTLIAVVQAGSFAPWENRRVAPGSAVIAT